MDIFKTLKIPEGWRTIAVSVAIAAGTAALSKLAGINWVDIVGPTWAIGIVSAINIAMRMITTTPVGEAPK